MALWFFEHDFEELSALSRYEFAGMNFPDKSCAPEHVRHCNNLSVG